MNDQYSDLDHMDLTSAFNVTANVITADPDATKQEQLNAFMYIIIVLGFYFIGVLIMLVKYIKRERRDYEEEKFLQDLFHYPKRTLAEERQFMNRRTMHTKLFMSGNVGPGTDEYII